ncbi:MAG: glycosyltransferase family 2 protein [Candidatus Brevundimonas colombiensis]|uniref:Glycosyltransferase family 2 protein n=1 Tax=Candidatus Brevundimonas colombiensis TaxID=3121376 RepID=A0AAJ5X2E6_9CAUL|nr:glycosyltransferase family 2 protein [Brevundimonas sp.]WEK40943.1 MAG: glycosyltransferase family 2 protein [Brevundimonas sp.]
MLNILIPMAGRGSRFSDAGYADPKPLIPVAGEPMIKLVIDNLTPPREHRFIFVCQRQHVADYGLRERLSAWAPGCLIVELDGVTEGAACTVLTAREHILDAPLMIANSDQYVDISIADYLSVQDGEGTRGLIMTMTANDPKWSFVALDADEHVTRVVEKEVISDEATVGIYNFANGSDFVRAAEQMIARDLRVNGEFYVAPVYNQLIEEGAQVRIFNVGSEAKGMYGLGTPADLDLFNSLGMAEKVAARRC